MWYFSPWEALPAGEADCDGWIEVTTGSGSTCDDGERDTNGETPTDLEDAAEGGDANGGGAVDGEACYGCDTGEAESSSGKDSVLNQGMDEALTRRRTRLLLRPCIPSASEVCSSVRRG